MWYNVVTTTNKTTEVYAMATIISQQMLEAQEANDSVRAFVQRFKVGKLLHTCRAHKEKGFSVVKIFVYLLCGMFSPISTYMSMRIGSYKEAFGKNTIYRFCNTVFVKIVVSKSSILLRGQVSAV